MEVHKLTASWMTQVIAHLERAYPDEGCGLLLRTRRGALRVHPVTNLADQRHALDPSAWPRTNRDSYVIDPLEIVRAASRGERLEVIFHSHCDHVDEFSHEDRRQALTGDRAPLWPGCRYLIVSVHQGSARHATLYQFNPRRHSFDAVEACDI